MVVCKYFLGGGCRFGNTCRYEHSNPTTYTPSVKGSILTSVAEEALLAERGGQWPLSCFSPGKEYSCFPGMEDVSPEEVRWEMYQAQKNGTVDQTKLQFQQLCQDMRSKREVLKNPSHEISAILDQIRKNNRETDFVNKSFTSPSTNPFGTALPSSSSSSTTTTGTFGNTNTQSVFGRQASFGGAPVFDSQSPPTNSIFGGTTNPQNSVFGGTQTMPAFASTNPPQSSSIFGNFTGTTQSSNFGLTTQTGNIFSNTQTTSSPFGNVQQPSGNVFGGGQTTPATNSIFGGTQSAVSTNSSSIFGQQQKPQLASSSSSSSFGGAPVFGSAPAFSTTQSTTGFGSQQSIFNNTMNNAFITNDTNSTTTFGSSGGNDTNTFASLVTPQTNNFQNTGQNNTVSPFTNSLPTSSSAMNVVNPFVSTTGFANFNSSNTPVFTNVSNTFCNVNSTMSNVNSPFGNNNFTSQGYESAPNYAVTPSTPFASTTATSTISNPFGQNSQQTAGVLGVTASGTTFGGMSAGPAGSFGINSDAIDPNVYTKHADISEDDKQMFMADQFILGKIPINPPSIELR